MIFDSIYFFYLSRLLNRKLYGKKLISLKFQKNNGIIEFIDDKYIAIFGKYTGVFRLGKSFEMCSDYKTVNLIGNYVIDEIEQLYLDRIIEIKMHSNDKIKKIERRLMLAFIGKLSIIITDNSKKIIFSNDLRFKTGEIYEIKNNLCIYKNLLMNCKYCGENILDLIKNIRNGIPGEGRICVNNPDKFKNKLIELEAEYCKLVFMKTDFELYQNELNEYIISDEIIKCKEKLVKYLEDLLKKKRNIIKDLDRRIMIDENEYIKKGNVIMYNKHKIKRGMKSIALPYYNENGIFNIKIDLKENLSPESNANYYFKKAEKIKKKRHNAILRKRIIETEINDLEKKLENLSNNPEELYIEWKKYKTKMKDRHTKGKKYFVLASGSYVYVGRNSEENDKLTLHFASPNDLFFHVREAPGSHVILKSDSGQHSQKDIELAASIAAYFSKMRNSKTVPVSYTEIRYVRKPRKAKSGTVILTKEKVIFVSPSIPVS